MVNPPQDASSSWGPQLWFQEAAMLVAKQGGGSINIPQGQPSANKTGRNWCIDTLPHPYTPDIKSYTISQSRLVVLNSRYISAMVAGIITSFLGCLSFLVKFPEQLVLNLLLRVCSWGVQTKTVLTLTGLPASGNIDNKQVITNQYMIKNYDKGCEGKNRIWMRG